MRAKRASLFVKSFFHFLNLAPKMMMILQERVKRWMHYTWSQQKSFDEHAMLSYLPLKMRTDIAMRVHYSTLGKVKLFRNCEPGLLKDLVVLLRPIIYLPGDYICRKNDIGKEMFIIQSGQVQVCKSPPYFKFYVLRSRNSLDVHTALKIEMVEHSI